MRVPSLRTSEFSNLLVAMAYDGAWRPVVDYLANAIATQTGIRDNTDGERVAHAFLAAHLSIVGHFPIHSARELNKGYADLRHRTQVPEARPSRGCSRRVRKA